MAEDAFWGIVKRGAEDTGSMKAGRNLDQRLTMFKN
jgi:hypothetical protein